MVILNRKKVCRGLCHRLCHGLCYGLCHRLCHGLCHELCHKKNLIRSRVAPGLVPQAGSPNCLGPQLSSPPLSFERGGPDWNGGTILEATRYLIVKWSEGSESGAFLVVIYFFEISCTRGDDKRHEWSTLLKLVVDTVSDRLSTILKLGMLDKKIMLIFCLFKTGGGRGGGTFKIVF